MAHLLLLAQAVIALEEAFPSVRHDEILLITRSYFREQARVLMIVMRPLKERRI